MMTIDQVAQMPTSATKGPLDIGELSGLIGFAMRRAQLAIFTDFLDAFALLQLKPAEFSVLALIDRNPGRKQADIAAALGIQRPNFVVMLAKLEARGLCTRLQAAYDKRSTALQLTQDGRECLAQARLIVAAHESRVVALVGERNVAGLLDMLQRIGTNLQGR